MRVLSAVHRAAVLLGAALAAWVLSASAARGDRRMVGLALAAACGLLIAARPVFVFLLTLILGATVLPAGSLQLTALGHVTDVVELAIFGLIAVWLVDSGLGQRASVRTPFLLFVITLLAGVVMGTVVGSSRGSTGHDMFGYIKPWCYYALSLPLAVWFSSPDSRRRLHQFVVVICVVGSVITLVVVASGVHVPFVGTRPYAIGTLGVQEAGIQRIRPDLVALLVLATLLVVGEIAVKGASAGRVLVLALFLLMQALTFTRSTWVPLVLCMAALGLLHPGRRRPLRGLTQGLAMAAVASVLIGGAAGGAFGHTGQAEARRLASVLTPRVLHEASYTDRETENTAAWRALSSHPLTGVGLAQPYGKQDVVYLPDPPRLVLVQRPFLHNQYLYAWLQLGILGLLALLVLACTSVWCLVTSRRLANPEDAVRGVAAALALVCFLFQFLLQTTILYPANILAVLTAMTLAAPPRRGAASLEAASLSAVRANEVPQGPRASQSVATPPT
jgi:O-antigen ligase